jgi:hypothetical protein
MSMAMLVCGRRLPDTKFGELPPEDIRPGDYWKYTGIDVGDAFSYNLTRTVWGYMSPDGNGIGTLMAHTVRENPDGSITIAAGDGSSNSVLHTGGASNKTWHGYVDHGVWKPV